MASLSRSCVRRLSRPRPAENKVFFEKNVLGVSIAKRFGIFDKRGSDLCGAEIEKYP